MKKEERATSLILLYNLDKKVLLQHRTDDAPTHPGHWGFFGGGADEVEEPLEAVLRECEEELGYKLTKPVLFHDHKCRDSYCEGWNYYYCEPYEKSKPLSLHEGQAMGWFTLKEALQKKVSQQDRAVLRKFFEFIS